jgi:hypothetical protein
VAKMRTAQEHLAVAAAAVIVVVARAPRRRLG